MPHLDPDRFRRTPQPLPRLSLSKLGDTNLSCPSARGADPGGIGVELGSVAPLGGSTRGLGLLELPNRGLQLAMFAPQPQPVAPCSSTAVQHGAGEGGSVTSHPALVPEGPTVGLTIGPGQLGDGASDRARAAARLRSRPPLEDRRLGGVCRLRPVSLVLKIGQRVLETGLWCWRRGRIGRAVGRRRTPELRVGEIRPAERGHVGLIHGRAAVANTPRRPLEPGVLDDVGVEGLRLFQRAHRVLQHDRHLGPLARTLGRVAGDLCQLRLGHLAQHAGQLHVGLSDLAPHPSGPVPVAALIRVIVGADEVGDPALLQRTGLLLESMRQLGIPSGARAAGPGHELARASGPAAAGGTRHGLLRLLERLQVGLPSLQVASQLGDPRGVRIRRLGGCPVGQLGYLRLERGDGRPYRSLLNPKEGHDGGRRGAVSGPRTAPEQATDQALVRLQVHRTVGRANDQVLEHLGGHVVGPQNPRMRALPSLPAHRGEQPLDVGVLVGDRAHLHPPDQRADPQLEVRPYPLRVLIGGGQPGLQLLRSQKKRSAVDISVGFGGFCPGAQELLEQLGEVVQLISRRRRAELVAGPDEDRVVQ